MSSEKKHIVYLDILNIFACLAVLFLHHNGIVHHYNVMSAAWREALFFEVAFYWAVPVFFMLTGATLLNYREKYSTKVFFKKRLTRTFLPFLLWSLLKAFELIIKGRLDDVSIFSVIDLIINTKLPSMDVYWFFIPLFGIYLSIPVLSLIAKKENISILWYMVVCAFITWSCLPLIFELFHIPFNGSLLFPLNGGGYILFVLLGYLLFHIELSKKTRYFVYCAGILSFLFRYLGTYYLSINEGVLVRTFFSYTQFHSVLLAVSVFVLIKYWNNEWLYSHSKFIRYLSSCSLGIYLMHRIFMDKFLRYSHVASDDVYWRFLGAFLTYIVCLTLVSIIKRIPYVRILVP